MGLVCALPPLPRAAARLAPRVGRPLLGAAPMHCLVPGWVLLRPPLPMSRPAWAEAALAVPAVRWPPARRASLLHLRTQALFGLGRLDEALMSTGKRVAAYRRLVLARRERALTRVSLVWARMLGELTSGLGALSQYEKALAVGREACDAADRVFAWTPARHRAAAAYPAPRRSGPLPRGHRRPDHSAHDSRQGRR